MKNIPQLTIFLFAIFFLAGCTQNNVDRQNSATQQSTDENTQKEYVLKRKEFCLDVYKTENNTKSNVQGWRYFESSDECFVVYKSSKPQTNKECDAQYPPQYNPGETYSGRTYAEWNSLCKEGVFEQSF